MSDFRAERPPYFTPEQWAELLRRQKLNGASAPVDEDPESPRQAASPFSDSALALRFVAKHAHHLRYVAKWSQWFRWNGARWVEDSTPDAFDLAHDLCREAAVGCRNKKEQKAVESAKTTAAVITLARADRRIAATTGQWDGELWFLNTPDGVVDLTTGNMRPHLADDYMTMITAVGPRGACPKFEEFLKQVMNGDEALIAFLWRALGYCLTGDVSEQAIFFSHGVGQNGKTTFMSTVASVLGSDYCLATPIETFTESKNDRHPTELARMRAARLVTATETEGGRYWAESRIKELTGGEKIAARFMHRDFFEYRPQFKPWVSGNHRPRLRSVGPAMRRRINMIPFAVKIPDRERDTQLASKLKDEWPGILQKMIDGCLDWQERGLAPPEAVTAATDAYFEGEDGYSDWIADCCDTGPTAMGKSSELFASWKAWAERNGQPARDSKHFREELERLGFPWKRANDANYYAGLFVRPPPTSPDGAGGAWEVR